MANRFSAMEEAGHLVAVGRMNLIDPRFLKICDNIKRSETCVYFEDTLMRIRRGRKTFTPRLVSIGPFHFSDNVEAQLPLQHRKSEYLRYCLARPSQKLGQGDFEAKKSFLRDFILMRKKRICQCYEDYDFNCNSVYDKRFADNILEDSFFVIEVFLRKLKASSYWDDYSITTTWNGSKVREDLLLMTNQLPYFLLTELYDLVFHPSAGGPSFDNLTQHYFEDLPPIIGGIQEAPENSFFTYVEDFIRSFLFWDSGNSDDDDGYHVPMSVSNAPPVHFTDFYRQLVLKENPELCSKRTSRSEFIGVPWARRLQRAGVTLKASKGASSPVMDVTFQNGVLTMLQLQLDNDSEQRLQSLIAFEQCHYPEEEGSICRYMKFIESLGKSEDDVEWLIREGIIINLHSGGAKEVRELLGRVCEDMILPTYMYQNVCRELIYHCGNRRWC